MLFLKKSYWNSDRVGNAIAIVLITLFTMAMCSCSSVKKVSSVKDATATTNFINKVDTARTTIYDTTRQTNILTEFQTKTVEVYDTVYNKKDSLVVILKTKTILSTGKEEKRETKAGIGLLSVSGASLFTVMSKTTVHVEETTLQRLGAIPWWLYLIFIIIFILIGVYFGPVIRTAISFINPFKNKS